MKEALKKQIIDRIEQRLKDLDIKPRVVGVQSGLGPDLVRDWKRSDAMPRLDSIARIAPILKTTPEWLAFGAGDQGEGEDAAGTRFIPKLSWVAASRFEDVAHVEGIDTAPHLTIGDLPHGEYIALDVSGDSMDRVAPEGSTIIVRTNERELTPRAFYVFLHDGAATFKRYMQQPDRLEPFSTNGSHEALPITTGTEVVGRVVRAITNLA
jgi:SOS-response transcriptional repressor LexA